MVHGFHVVPVEIAQEDAVVARVVLRPLPRRVRDLGARLVRRSVNGVDGVRPGAANARCSSRVSLPPAGTNQKSGEPSGPPKPTTIDSPWGKRMISRMPIGAKARR